MRATARIVPLVAIALAAAPMLRAQSAPNLSGTWVMVPEKSDLGGMASMGARTDVIDHREPKLSIKRTLGDQTINLTYEVDGKPWKNTIPQGDVTSTLKWEGAVLAIHSTLTAQGNDVTVEDRYSLSADGKTLTQARTVLVQGQQISQTFVFAKQ